MKRTLLTLVALLLAPLAALHAAEPPAAVPQSVTQVWAGYDPNKGDFREEIVKEETKDGNYYRESYISAYVVERRSGSTVSIKSRPAPGTPRVS